MSLCLTKDSTNFCIRALVYKILQKGHLFRNFSKWSFAKSPLAYKLLQKSPCLTKEAISDERALIPRGHLLERRGASCSKLTDTYASHPVLPQKQSLAPPQKDKSSSATKINSQHGFVKIPIFWSWSHYVPRTILSWPSPAGSTVCVSYRCSREALLVHFAQTKRHFDQFCYRPCAGILRRPLNGPKMVGQQWTIGGRAH